MKPLRCLPFITLALCMAVVSVSTRTTAEQVATAPTPTLEQIASQLQSKPVQQGRFEQRKYLSILPKPLLSNGYFLFQSHDQSLNDNHRQLVWQIESPLSSRLTFSKQGILQEQNGQQQWLARGDQPGVATLGDVMTALLTNDWIHLQRYFGIQVLPDSNPHTWQLQLRPREAPLAKMIERIEMSGDDQLRHIILWEAGDNRTEIDFLPLTSVSP